jgi:hypothetical protein
VIPKRPKIAELADCRASPSGIDRILFVRHIAQLQNQVDLRNLKAGNRNVEVGLDGQEILQFDRKDRVIPARVLADLVVCEDVRPYLPAMEDYGRA